MLGIEASAFGGGGGDTGIIFWILIYDLTN